MVDPVTAIAIAIANGATGLALKCASVAKSLNDLTNKHKKANLAIMAMKQLYQRFWMISDNFKVAKRT